MDPDGRFFTLTDIAKAIEKFLKEMGFVPLGPGDLVVDSSLGLSTGPDATQVIKPLVNAAVFGELIDTLFGAIFSPGELNQDELIGDEAFF